MDPMQQESNNPYGAPMVDMSTMPSTDEPVLASLERRLGAAIVDTTISIAIVLLFGSLYFGGVKNFPPGVAALGVRGTIISTVLSLVVYLAVNGKWLSQSGQTVGKKLLKIKIVRTDGSPAGLKRIVLYRFLPVQLTLLVPVFGNLLPLIDVLFIFRSSRQCIHDQIADTKVILAR